MGTLHFLTNINENFFKRENPQEQKPRFLYKTMPLENFLKTIKKGLWFAKPSEWTDPFEKRFYSARCFVNGENKIINPLKDRFLCCCMTSIGQSEAHWNIYSREQIGIQLKINREKFISFLEKLPQNYNFFIGKAEYQKQTEIEDPLFKNTFLGKSFNYQDNNDLVKLLLLKRKAFEYEKEVRFIIMNNKRKEYKQKGFAIKGAKIKFIETIDSIKISPQCPKETASFLKGYLKQILSNNIKINHNHLYDETERNRSIIIK